MFCNNCGAPLEDNASVCTRCGKQVPSASDTASFFTAPSSEAPKATPVSNPHPVYTAPAAPVVKKVIPEEYQPLSPWAYLGLQILFAIPIVGFIFLIIFSCNGSNLSRRNFARSYWCALLLVVIVIAILAIFAFASGGAVRSYYNYY